MKILVGISGGVDSSYAALKLIDDGHTVVGANLIMHEHTDVEAAREAAARLGIPLVEIDCTHAFDEIVKTYFENEYKEGRTPNPCIVCNPEVKFRFLSEYAREHGFDRIATGHYARIVERNGRFTVARAKDATKDQTYMLYRLPQDILSMLVFPLSDSIKKEVKELAAARGISEPDVKESQEICFIPDNDYRSFLEQRMGKFPPGNFIDKNGRIIGTHRGIISYTVGQRKGLGVSLGQRVFVSRIDPVKNEVTLTDSESVSNSFTASDVVFSGRVLRVGESVSADVKIRYHHIPVSATVTCTEKGRIRVDSVDPVGFVAPGQSVVVYDTDEVLLGGFID